MKRTGYYCQIWRGQSLESSSPDIVGDGSYKSALQEYQAAQSDLQAQEIELYKGTEERVLMYGCEDLPEPHCYCWQLVDGCDWENIKTWTRPVSL